MTSYGGRAAALDGQALWAIIDLSSSASASVSGTKGRKRVKRRVVRWPGT
ncbi:MAG: hypothetical protein U0795_24125 [Pirellulales bacterium]